MTHPVLERALDMLDYALLIVDERGRLVYRNRAATSLLRSTASPLAVSAGTLRGRSRALRAELRRNLAHACATGRILGLFAPADAALPLRIVVAPLALADGARGAAIWVAAAHPRALPDETTLRTLFGLSPAEARLAVRLLAGHTVQECARGAGVGVATVRSQLHTMFAKTGARRQAELIALLSRIPALAFGGAPG